VRTLRDKSSTTYSILVAMLQIVFSVQIDWVFLFPLFADRDSRRRRVTPEQVQRKVNWKQEGNK